MHCHRFSGHLPRDATVTLNVVGDGGESWTCQGEPMVCGPHPAFGSSPARSRAVELSSDGQGPYSGMLYLGMRTTASRPKVAPATAAGQGATP